MNENTNINEMTDDDISFTPNVTVNLLLNVDQDVHLRFVATCRNTGISIHDLVEQAMVRECDYRDNEKRYNIKDLLATKKDKFRSEINAILEKNGQNKPEWD